MSTGEKLINDGSNAVLSLEDFLLRYAIIALFSQFPNFSIFLHICKKTINEALAGLDTEQLKRQHRRAGISIHKALAGLDSKYY